ncbi:iron (metal) dependent repressor, DtxR family [Peptostreptococcaceae bacterium pGA-8]|nr:iron (metal) dependent repressor, DtxR family [Peptostreptococcaceae bacterium pGA-8]
MSIQESGEMYLETILILSKEQPQVRAIDVATYRELSRASVSRGLGLLRDDGYIDVDQSGHITLTEKGKERANSVYDKHNVLSSILKKIGVRDEVATEDACRMEHYMSDESFEAIKKYFGFK